MNIRINKSILAAVLGITACSKDAARIPEGSNIEIRAEVSYEALEGSSAVPKALQWEYGDEISLLHHNGNHILSCISSGEKAHFKGTAPKLPDGGNYLAVFPYRLDYILQEETSSPGQKYSFKVEMPSVLPLTPDSVNPCIGSGFLQNGEINIKHSTGYLCYTISRNDIKYISISSDDGFALGGSFVAEVDSEGKVTFTGQADATTPELLSNCGCIAGTYLITLPPANYRTLTIKLLSSEGSSEQSFRMDGYPKRGTITDLGTLDSGISWHSLKKPEIRLLSTSSSTISANWSISNFQSPEIDLAHDWSIGLYEDAQCRQLRVSWNISSAQFTTPEGSIRSLGGFFTPRFIFTGLEAGKNYYIKAWYTNAPECVSNVLPARTPRWSNVTLDKVDGISSGSVLLAEDFSEVIWGGDFAGRCWSYTDSNAASAPAFDNADGTNPAGEQIVSGFKHNFVIANPSIEEGLFSTMKYAVRNSRLKDWASISEDASKSRVCSRSGYVKLGGGNKCGGIVTPAIKCLENKSRVSVSFKTHPYRALANDNIRLKIMAISTPEGSLNSEGTYANTYTIKNALTITPSQSLEWNEHNVELTLEPGDKVAIYTQRASGVSTGQARVLLDDVKLTYLGTAID